MSRPLYQLHISPGEHDGEGEDHDEWFTSLRIAKRRRQELIDADPTMEDCKYHSDYQIECVYLAGLSRRALVLAILNRRGWIDGHEVVVEAYRKPERVCEGCATTSRDWWRPHPILPGQWLCGWCVAGEEDAEEPNDD